VPRRGGGGWVSSADFLTEKFEGLLFGPDEAACCPVKFGDKLMKFEGIVDQCVGSF